MSAERGSVSTHFPGNNSEKESLLQIVEFFDQAEARVKEVEQLSSQLSIPSVNQLRYVGYHLARSICSTDTPAEFSSQIEKAKRHCKRAIYDAVEVGILYLLEKIQQFQNDYAKNSEIVDVLGDKYIELSKKAENAKDFIAEVNHGHDESRDQYYEKCQPVYSELREIVRTLEISRPAINLLIKQNKEREEKERKAELTEARRFIVFVCLSVIAILIALYEILI